MACQRLNGTFLNDLCWHLSNTGMKIEREREKRNE